MILENVSISHKTAILRIAIVLAFVGVPTVDEALTVAATED